MSTDVEFWPMRRVLLKVGLSKSEIYRQVADGRFPPSHGYTDNPKKRFWLSTDVLKWMRRQAPGLLGTPAVAPPVSGDDFDGLMG